ncbi:DUF732 domain-containing protein [uncultured Corynebacterium sp.]|uniref:DUF732 domain-containing protein n=1 Tax=uncultured Corynebacterium sp. TaxID=159447 RepID=UPI0025EE496F|nr:DUF732 domain-containing protein [uncultured Corynebacterium sp.]
MTTSRRTRAALALVGVGVLALAGCGDSTVDSSDVTETATASSEVPESSTAADDSADASESEETSTTRTSARPNGERDVTEPGATRASEVPDGRMPLSAADEEYLDALIDEGIDVAGTEDQLIATGRLQCGGEGEGADGDALVVGAIAGQLVTQGRTDDDEETVTRSIAEAAESAYC